MGDLVKYDGGPMVPADPPGGAGLDPHRPGSLVTPDHAAGGPTGRGAPARRLAVAVIAASIIAAVAVGAAAFGGGGSTSGSAQDAAAQGSLAASASNSASADSAAFTVTATTSGPGTTTTLLTGSGSVDLSSGRAQMQADIPAVSSLLGGGGSDGLTLVSDGHHAYLDLPALSTFTGGKSWVEATLPGSGSGAGGSAGGASISALADPARLLGVLSSLTGHVTRVGNVRLGGTETTEYRTTLTAADIASHLAAGRLPSGRENAAGRTLQTLGLPSVPVTAWVGSDGRLRQLSASVDLSHLTLGGLSGILGLSGSGSGAGSAVTVTVGLTDYGAPVSISVPPASEVTDLNGLFSSLDGGMSSLGGALSGLAHRI
jgi:hypothetical protein